MNCTRFYSVVLLAAILVISSGCASGDWLYSIFGESSTMTRDEFSARYEQQASLASKYGQ